MLYYTEYAGHEYELLGKRNKCDNTIYTFDIETTSYIIYNNKMHPAVYYAKLNKKQQESCRFGACCYEWTMSINDEVYYGRTLDEFVKMLDRIEFIIPEKKIIYVHNLSFEFQFIKSYLDFASVFARKSHKVMKAKLRDYNIEFRCTYFMSNCKLSKLPEVFMLPITKAEGDLDYNIIRNSETPLTDKELGYCERDCLVVYEYIKKLKDKYKRVDKIPLTQTGFVREELKECIALDYGYKNKVRKAINVEGHVFNLLTKAFAGGYTHANWIYANQIIKDVSSFDFTSSYPYVLVTHKYPSTAFKKTNIKSVEEMSDRYAYLITVKFYNIQSKYYNNFISQSKCTYIKKGRYDNGRVMYADELEITLTDVDFRFILLSHKYDSYEIIESYLSYYDYLPIQFINFCLDKYVEKTKYKNVKGKELEYNLAKQRFNALYGMSVTNNIRDDVVYNNETKQWEEVPLNNEKIQELLNKEKKKAFLSYAYGVWVTAYARNNLLKNVIKLDKYVVYCDTDSIKIRKGYDINVINEYNNFVKQKINYVSKKLKIPVQKFMPEDIFGEKHCLGLFDNDANYDEFITQGAKKYAYKIGNELGLTVSGVSPKKGVKCMKTLDDFRDDLVFDYEHTGKNLLMYCENQPNIQIVDYLGNVDYTRDKSGICLIPTTYVLGKSLEYAHLIESDSSNHSVFKE